MSDSFEDRSSRRPPPLPERPTEGEPRRKSAWSIIFALIVGLMMLVGLAFLAAPLGPIVLVMAGGLIVLLVAAFAHYIFWGYWLGDSIRREVEEEEERERTRESGP